MDWAYRIAKVYNYKKSGMKCKSIIVRFTTFWYRTIFYHNRKNLKLSLKVKLYVTKKPYLFFKKEMQLVNNNEVVKFVLVDIKWRLKVVFKDRNSLF